MPASHVCHAGAFVALVGLAVTGCRTESAEQIVSKASVLAEEDTQGTLYWEIDARGDTLLVVKDDKREVVKHGVTGQLLFTTAAGSPQMVELKSDEDTGIVRADGPDLKGLTEVKYTLIVNGKTRTGALHLPEAGTEGLVKTAKQNEATTEVAASHGGTVQLVGEHRYEVVADAESGETRVYILGQVDAKPKALKLALDADTPRVVELSWHADGYYFAKLDVNRPPRKLTLVEVVDDHVHVALVGFRPGAVVNVGVRPVFWVRRGWVAYSDRDHPGLARGHYKGDPVRGPPGQAKVNVKIKDKDHGKGGRTKVTIKAH